MAVFIFQMVNIAAQPAHPGRGLGKAIVAALVDHLRAIALKGTYVSLMVDG